jgi:serine phosphatase RsbU (regulator of sigma subunit)
MRSYGWRNWQDALRESLIAIFLGALLALVENRDAPPAWLLRGAMIVLSIVLAARGLETALSWAIEQSRIPNFFRFLLYILGGGIACFLTVGFELDLVDTLLVGILAAGALAFVLHHNRKRTDRLRANIERLKEHEFAEKELQIAREMQTRLLPPPLVEREGFRVIARTHAAHIVGGDFYDVLGLPDGRTAIIAADVSGKGIAASLIMASCKAMIPFLATHGGAADVMNELNARLAEQLQRREFVAMVFVRFDPKSGSAEIVNAGMPDPLLSGAPVVCPGERLPLGAMKGTRYTATNITVNHGDRLLLFSDGLCEATIDGSPIGEEKVAEIAARTNDIDALIAEVRALGGLLIDDDTTVVCIERV